MSDYRIVSALSGLPRSGALNYALPSAARTTGGDSGPQAVQNVRSLALDVDLTAIVGTLVVFLDRQDVSGAWRQVYASADLTAVGVTSVSIGPGLPVNVALTDAVRLRWTVTGVGASATFSASLVGR